MTLSSQPSIDRVLRQAQELSQALSIATGYRSLLRQFAEALRQLVGIERIGFARIQKRQGQLILKKRGVKLPVEIASLDAETEILTSMADALQSLNQSVRKELADGWTRLSTPSAMWQVALLDDPSARAGTIVFIDATAMHGDPVTSQVLDFAVRQLQIEARWYRKLDKAQAMIYRDDLTHLYNTRYLDVAIESELRRADRFSTQFCLLFIDLDSFKPINDQHGHLSGSSVLKQVADIIRDAVREVDIPIRYGGDEFVILLLGATTAKGLLVAERIRRLIEQREFYLEDGSGTARLTASIGVASFPEHGRDRATLLRIADETMYSSKRNGKNQVTTVALSS